MLLDIIINVPRKTMAKMAFSHPEKRFHVRESLVRTFDDTQIVPIILFIFEFQWDDHQLEAILALKTLSCHETNIGVDTDTMASNTYAE